MKSALDLILERLEGMSDDEIVKATSYTSEPGSCELFLDGYEFYYLTNSNQSKDMTYSKVELKENFKYELEEKVTYNEKAVGGYFPIVPFAA